jgi:hypothetical protein
MDAQIALVLVTWLFTALLVIRETLDVISEEVA